MPLRNSASVVNPSNLALADILLGSTLLQILNFSHVDGQEEVLTCMDDVYGGSASEGVGYLSFNVSMVWRLRIPDGVLRVRRDWLATILALPTSKKSSSM